MIETLKTLGPGGAGGFLAGLAAVAWIEPTTTGGTGLLIAVFVALGILLAGLVRWLWRQRAPGDR